MPHETIGGRLRCGDRTIPHRPSAWIEERFLASRLLRKLLAEGIRTKARSGPTPQTLPVGHEAAQILQWSSTSVAQASIKDHSKALWMLMLGLRNRASFSAEELQSCLDN